MVTEEAGFGLYTKYDFNSVFKKEEITKRLEGISRVMVHSTLLINRFKTWLCEFVQMPYLLWPSVSSSKG